MFYFLHSLVDVSVNTGLFREFTPISLVHRLCYSLKWQFLPCGSDDFVDVDCLWSRCFGEVVDKFFCYFFLSAGRLGVFGGVS